MSCYHVGLATACFEAGARPYRRSLRKSRGRGRSPAPRANQCSIAFVLAFRSPGLHIARSAAKALGPVSGRQSGPTIRTSPPWCQVRCRAPLNAEQISGGMPLASTTAPRTMFPVRLSRCSMASPDQRLVASSPHVIATSRPTRWYLSVRGDRTKATSIPLSIFYALYASTSPAIGIANGLGSENGASRHAPGTANVFAHHGASDRRRLLSG